MTNPSYANIRSFKDLELWRKAHEFVVNIFKLAKELRRFVQFSITHQLCKAALSITNNISEGTGRRTTRELIQYLYISRGSIEECRNMLILIKDLGMIDPVQFDALEAAATDISKMTNGLIKSLARRN